MLWNKTLAFNFVMKVFCSYTNKSIKLKCLPKKSSLVIDLKSCWKFWIFNSRQVNLSKVYDLSSIFGQIEMLLTTSML